MKMNFDSWYNKMLNEGVPASAVKDDTKVETTTASTTQSAAPTVSVPSKEEILGDVDSIMTQLNQLSAQIKEERIALEKEYGFESLDESLLLEGAWDDTKASFGDLFSDPLFQLVGLGIGAVIGAIGLSVKAVKDTKRNSAIGAQVMNDYNKLKSMKIEEVKLEAMIQKLEQQKDEISAETDESFINEAPEKPVAQKPAPEKPATKPAAKPDAKTPVAIDKSDRDAAKDKMVARIDSQINSVTKKKDSLGAGITKLEEVLDAKYAEDKITGFGSKKVSRLIAAAKDGMEQEVATLKLKLMADTMDPEQAADLKERIQRLAKESAERRAEIEQEAEENAKKAQELADKDEETKKALEELKKQKEKGNTEPEGTEAPADTTEPTNDGPSDAEQAAANAQQKNIDAQKNSEEAKKKREDRAENKADDQAAADKEANKGTKQGKLDRVEDMIKKEEEKANANPEVKKAKDKIAELEDAIDTLKSKETKEKGDEDKISMIQKGIEAEKKKIEAANAKNDKLTKLKDLKDRIAAKESWQLEGTELGRLFEMEISTLENEYLLNESRLMRGIDRFKALL